MPAQKSHLWLHQLTLCRLKEVGHFFTALQEGMQDLQVEFLPFIIVSGGHPPVIHVLIDIAQIFIQNGSKVSTHGPLKEGRGVAQSKVYNGGMVRSKASFYCSLVLIFWRDSDIIIAPPNVHFGEEGFPL
jgi:hypothetical protein